LRPFREELFVGGSPEALDGSADSRFTIARDTERVERAGRRFKLDAAGAG
jgi:hypothetical protein